MVSGLLLQRLYLKVLQSSYLYLLIILAIVDNTPYPLSNVFLWTQMNVFNHRFLYFLSPLHRVDKIYGHGFMHHLLYQPQPQPQPQLFSIICFSKKTMRGSFSLVKTQEAHVFSAPCSSSMCSSWLTKKSCSKAICTSPPVPKKRHLHSCVLDRMHVTPDSQLLNCILSEHAYMERQLWSSRGEQNSTSLILLIFLEFQG